MARFKKGSLAAKRYMAKIRRKRHKKQRMKHRIQKRRKTIKRKRSRHPQKRKTHKIFRSSLFHRKRHRIRHRNKRESSKINLAAILPIGLGIGLLANTMQPYPSGVPKLTPQQAEQLALNALSNFTNATAPSSTTTTIITSGGQKAAASTPPLQQPITVSSSTTPLTSAQIGALQTQNVVVYGTNQTSYQGIGIYSFGGNSYYINSASMFAQIATPIAAPSITSNIIAGTGNYTFMKAASTAGQGAAQGTLGNPYPFWANYVGVGYYYSPAKNWETTRQITSAADFATYNNIVVTS